MYVTLDLLVDEELRRQKAVLALLDAGELPGRNIPGFGKVEDVPPHHTEGGKDGPWRCRWCAHNRTCQGLPTGRVPLAEVAG